jgi:TPR repeat protein
MCRYCIEGNPVDKFRKCEDYYNSSKNGTLISDYDILSCLNDLNELCNKNFVKAYVLFGDMYNDGHFVEKNTNKAIEYYEKAAVEKSNNALLKLGILYYELNDKEKSYKYLNVASENGFVEAQFVYGIYLVRDIYNNINNDIITSKKTFEYLYKSSENNIIDSYLEVANCYYLGIGTEKNVERAFEYYKKAADYGVVDGLYFTGLFLYYGIGNQKNFKQAKQYLSMVIESDSNHRDTSEILDEMNKVESFYMLSDQFESINISE